MRCQFRFDLHRKSPEYHVCSDVQTLQVKSRASNNCTFQSDCLHASSMELTGHMSCLLTRAAFACCVQDKGMHSCPLSLQLWWSISLQRQIYQQKELQIPNRTTPPQRRQLPRGIRAIPHYVCARVHNDSNVVVDLLQSVPSLESNRLGQVYPPA